MFFQRAFSDPFGFAAWMLVVIFSICFHEYMHARAALWQGDPTAADQGHLTLNPLRQMGIISLIMLFFLGIAWGQVPVQPQRMRHKYSDILVSLAGPLANLFLFFVFSIMLGIIFKFSKSQELIIIMAIGGMLNFVLFVFNMLPVPGFDGWHIVQNLFPRIHIKNAQFVYGTYMVVLFLAITFIQYLFRAGNYLTGTVAKGIYILLGGA